MTLHKCSYCDYTTPKKSNYNRHMNTHNTELQTTNIICDLCGLPCARKSSLLRHKTKCINHHINKNKMEHTIDNITVQLQLQEQLINTLKTENENLKHIVDNAGLLLKTSISTMSYVMKNYNNAPAIELIKDYSIMHIDQDNTKFVETLICEHKHKNLYAYLGDFIIKFYKKGDPSQQSIWNSDTNRVTYIIREIINNNHINWTIDKKGIKTGKYIIEPLLEYIDAMLRLYISNMDMQYRKYSINDINKKTIKLQAITEIIKSIEDKVLNSEIIKYVTPHFYLNKIE